LLQRKKEKEMGRVKEGRGKRRRGMRPPDP
jgi:hypothetical protein